MNISHFEHGQWYRITVDGDQEGIHHYYLPHRYDLMDPLPEPSEEEPTIVCRDLMVEHGDFFESIESYVYDQEDIVKAEPLSVRELVLELLSFIQQDHNQHVEESTGLTSTGQPPMVLRVKANGWICLDAASFYDRNIKNFGVMATAIDANYELLQSEVLVNSSGRSGVCLEIELHGGQ